MKELIISDLKFVTQEMIDALETWLQDVKMGQKRAGATCPFQSKDSIICDNFCGLLFDNKPLKGKTYCPCYDHNFGEEATILAFTIICDVWREYHKKENK